MTESAVARELEITSPADLRALVPGSRNPQEEHRADRGAAETEHELILAAARKVAAAAPPLSREIEARLRLLLSPGCRSRSAPSRTDFAPSRAESAPAA